MPEHEDLSETPRQIALLVDGDNIGSESLPAVLEETSKYGTIAVRRIYGDWTRSSMSGWKDALQSHAMQPVQQFAYTTGKNATDSALIIDAMDLLHSGRFGAFCIVSSDSDYTRLATRIREQGLGVIGIGEKKTPRSLVSACNVFVFIENLSSDNTTASASKRRNSEVSSAGIQVIKELVEKAFQMTVHEDGWANLGGIGNQLHSLEPSFDCRTYGHKRLVDLIRSLDGFEVRYSNPEGPGSVFIRQKEGF